MSSKKTKAVPSGEEKTAKKAKKAVGKTKDAVVEIPTFFFCLENGEGKHTFTTQEHLVDHLTKGWILQRQESTLKKAEAWLKEVTSQEEEESPSIAGSSGTLKNDSVVDEEALEAEYFDDDSSPTETETHNVYNNRNGRYYRSLLDVRKAKMSGNDSKLATLGLKGASKGKKKVITSKKSAAGPKEKNGSASKKQIMRSTRAKNAKAPVQAGSEEEQKDGTEIEDEIVGFSEEGADSFMESNDDEERALSIGRWGEKYLELVVYKEKHGNCNVSRNKDKYLGIWVKSQRTHGKHFCAGNKAKAHGMTQEKIDMLNRLGFKWGKHRKTPVSWETRFRELEEHIEIFGDCDDQVKTTYASCTDLGKWVSRQRMYFQNKKAGIKVQGDLTIERIKRLKGIGFDFDGPCHKVFK